VQGPEAVVLEFEDPTFARERRAADHRMAEIIWGDLAGHSEQTGAPDR
jgi:hypothetical protein